MFIEQVVDGCALRQEGNVLAMIGDVQSSGPHGPPDGGRIPSFRGSINMPLLRRYGAIDESSTLYPYSAGRISGTICQS